MGCAAALEVDSALQERVLMSAPTATSHGTYSHGLGDQLKTTRSILALMLIWNNISATD